MYNFTEEELIVIAQYPKQAVDHANKKMQAMFNAHKPIHSPFKWFCSVCEDFIKNQSNKTPETGKSKPIANNNHYLRTKDNWIEGGDVVQTPGTRQSTVTKVESQMECAINIERTLHDRFLNDSYFHKGAAMYANPLGELISQSIMDEIHQDCECRSNVVKELHVRVQEAVRRDSSSTTEQPVTKHHGFDWNSLVPISKSTESPAKPEFVPERHELKSQTVGIIPTSSHELDLVSDNTTDFMSLLRQGFEGQAEQYLGEEYGEYDEIID